MSYIKIIRDEKEVEVEVTGSFCKAEPDIGIMSAYFEDICAVNAYGVPVELTEDEEEKACEALLEDHYDYEPSYDY